MQPDVLLPWLCGATPPLPSGNIYPDPHWPADFAAQHTVCRRCGQPLIRDQGWRTP
jgi:hypothetical protein